MSEAKDSQPGPMVDSQISSAMRDPERQDAQIQKAKLDESTPHADEIHKAKEQLVFGVRFHF